jgi:DNA-binding CsgD family transcriptional regulator
MRELEDFMDRLKGADSLDEQRRVFERTIKDQGFKFYTYNITKVAGLGDHTPVFTTSYPTEWVQRYLSENYYTIDPLVLEGPRRRLPFLWSDVAQPTELTRKQGQLYSEAADLGILNGMTIPIHGRDGEYAAINLIPDGTLKEQKETMAVQRHAAHLIALYYHAHSGVSLLEQRLEKLTTSLTPRETEILTWIARGKSSWEVSQILSVSERTILFHIDNAKRKMGVSSRTHLVVRAAMEGLIQP